MSLWKTATFTRKGNYLFGSFIKQPEVDGYINSVNPGDLSDQLGKFPFGASSADDAVACAREAFPAWHRSSPETRKACLQRYREQLSTNLELLSVFLTRETGKPYWEAHAEVLTTIKRVDLALEHGVPQLDGWWLPELEGGYEFHPRGVVVVLGSYSMPLQVPNNHIIPALLAGNTVVFKPSKYTPAIGQLIAELLDRARLPRGVFNLVQGSGKVVGQRLVAHPQVDSIHMDGSLETGLEIRKTTLAEPWKRLVLNTCGRGTALVLDDADVDKAAYEIVVGGLLTTGQRRSSTSRVLVTRGAAEPLLRRLVQVIEGLSIGHGFEEEIFLGPLISEVARKRFLSYVQAAEKEGHALLCKGRRLDLKPAGYYVRPSLIRLDPRATRRYLNSDEVVGPALEVQVVADLDEAVEVHNRSKMGLVTALFSRDRANLAELRYRLRVGVLNLNRSTVSLSARLPLDGQGSSGNGMPMGLYAVRTCTFPMAYLEDNRPFDPQSLLAGVRWPADPQPTPPEDESPSDEDTQPTVMRQAPSAEEKPDTRRRSTRQLSKPSER